MSLWLDASEPSLAHARLQAANVYFNLAEQELSRFRPDSGLSRLNSALGRSVKVGPLLWAVLSSALDGARSTNGLYDPTVLNALVSAGYSGSFDTIGNQVSPVPVATGVKVGWEGIQMDEETRSVTLPPETRIDLGGIAKGWVASQVAQDLSSLGACLVDAGGDIAAIGHPPEMEGWPIGVADPHSPESDLAVLSIKDQGVATSGVDYRHWEAGGSRQHHIIDPRTGLPAQTDLLSVTVVAKDPVQAELYAKVALILGAQDGWKYLAGLTSTEAILVLQDGSNAITHGLPDYLWRDS